MPNHRATPADPAGLARAAQAIASGGLVVIPTDTVYGVAANPRDQAAAARLFAAKGRPAHLALPVLVPDAAAAAGLAARLGPAAAALMAAFWPGPLTLVVEADPAAALHLGGPAGARGTIALRQPDHPAALALLRLTGPLAVTSANLSGQPPALTCAEALRQLGGAVAVGLEAGVARGGKASTIVDLARGGCAVLRPGAVPAGAVRRALAAAGLAPQPAAAARERVAR
ncbi:MAG: threonylcarbamoyl-AMP synthase [Bifidobacteriaceae bacterium]|jgi:tRNA threonylcarbamoyl adenosine modification protein (Sua5/YciO/YrdC/YwlC family)|nr:threonylcarbamoyl-AMP synthase [Bifidobacteriaceae bacterium]